MEKVIEAIMTRRSVKSYLPDMPPKELVNKVIDAGLAAASGMNRQSPVIICLMDSEVKERYKKVNAEICGAQSDPFYGAPVILIVLADKNCSTHVYDGSLVMGNMMLAAYELGLGSCWIHRAREAFGMPEWQSLLNELGIEGEYEGIGNLALGYIKGDYPPEKPRRENRVFYVE